MNLKPSQTEPIRHLLSIRKEPTETFSDSTRVTTTMTCEETAVASSPIVPKLQLCPGDLDLIFRLWGKPARRWHELTGGWKSKTAAIKYWSSIDGS